MATIVIDWVGDGYFVNAFKHDLREAAKIVNFKDPLWYTNYDGAGIIITNNPDDELAVRLRDGVRGWVDVDQSLIDGDFCLTDNWLRDHFNIYIGSKDMVSINTMKMLRKLMKKWKITLEKS